MGLMGNKLYSAFKMKCPRCHGDDLFTHKNPYRLNKLFDMPDKCSKCGQKFTLEPGFYYGAMYVSYALSVAYLVTIYVLMLLILGEFHLEWYLIGGVGSLAVLTPVNFRLSRAFYINFFVAYDPEAAAEHKKKQV